MRCNVAVLLLVDWEDLEVGLVLVVAVVGALAAAVVAGEVRPLAVVVEELQLEVVVLQNSEDFHKGTANRANYRTPVASHLGANRTAVLARHPLEAKG